MLQKLKDFPWAMIAGFFVVYSTIAGCLWHLGYWSTFKFNFLEFATFGDLFKASIYPFFSKIWIFIAISIFPFGGSINFGIQQIGRRSNSNLNNTKIHNKYIGGILVLTAGLTFIYSGLLFNGGSIWNVLPFSFSMSMACLIYISGIFKGNIKDDFIRLIIWFLFFLYPCLNYSIAKKKSIEVLHMFRYQQVVSVMTSDSLIRNSILNTAYVGNSGKNYFFFEPTRVIVVNSDKIDAITLQEKLDEKNYKLWLNAN